MKGHVKTDLGRSGAWGRRAPFVTVVLALATVAGASCFIDNPGAPPAGATSTLGTSTSDGTGGRDGGAMGTGGIPCDAGPQSLCDKYGGYDTIQAVVNDFMARIAADCRIAGFFSALPPDHLQHFSDCLVKQLAVMTHCACIAYDVDSNGVACRDMKSSHMGLGIRAQDYQAFVEDVSKSFLSAGFSMMEVSGLQAPLDFYTVDIVDNSAPGYSKATCDGGDGG